MRGIEWIEMHPRTSAQERIMNKLPAPALSLASADVAPEADRMKRIYLILLMLLAVTLTLAHAQNPAPTSPPSEAQTDKDADRYTSMYRLGKAKVEHCAFVARAAMRRAGDSSTPFYN